VTCWSQWPNSLQYVLSLVNWTRGLWYEIPLEAWMCVHIFLHCVALCVGRGLALGWSPVQGVLPTLQKINLDQNRPRGIILEKMMNKWFTVVSFPFKIIPIFSQTNVTETSGFSWTFLLCEWVRTHSKEWQTAIKG